MLLELESGDVADDSVASAVDGLGLALDALVKSVRLKAFIEPDVDVVDIDCR